MSSPPKPATASRGSSTASALRPPLPPNSPPRTTGAGDPPVPSLAPAIKMTIDSESREGHKRQVSWSGFPDNTSLQQPVLQSASLSSNNNGSGRVTQEELAQQMPMETEGESYIVNSLENLDPTMGEGRGERSIMSNISDHDLQALTTADSDSVAAGKNSRNIRKPGSTRSTGSKNNKFTKVANVVRAGHRRKETIGDKLQGLTAAMDAVHLQHLDFLDDDNDAVLPSMISNTTENHGRPPASSADAFHHNTNLLFRAASKRTGLIDARSPSKRTGLDGRAASRRTGLDLEQGNATNNTLSSRYLSSAVQDIATSSDNVVDAEKRWKMLKHAVAATNMIDQVGESTEEIVTNDNLEIPNSSVGDEPQGNNIGSFDSTHSDDAKGVRKGRRRKKRNHADSIFRDLQDFVSPSSFTAFYFIKISICLIMIPSLVIAAILFYFADNPPTGIVDLDKSAELGSLVNKDGDPISDKTASASWWLLFLGVRQVLIFLLGKILECIVIDLLCVRSRISVRVLGPWATLFLLQTKGWPFMAFTWGICSIALLTGTKPFFHHWGFWQDYVDLFNESNPSGEVVNSIQYHRATAIAVALGVIVSAKRFWLGLYLGRQTYTQFSNRLVAVMNKALLVSEVAALGRAFERYASTHRDVETRRSVTVATYGVSESKLQGLLSSEPLDASPGANESQDPVDTTDANYVIDPEDRHPMTGQLSQAQRARILTLLGQWSEPTLAEKEETAPTVNEILQFRRALEYLHSPYPFSGSFGLADRRETTIISAQEVYERLLIRSPDPDTLNFDVVGLLGVSREGDLDQDKLKDLIKLFRPDRDGTMECVHFVKAIDEVYKELRLLRASVANSSKIDRASERIFNVLFYAILCCLILSQLGYDPLALFLSISGVVLAFAFMIGSASSKYFEGLLFILARRPFQIGDCIALSGVNDQTPGTGSPQWIVEDVDLFTTKLVFTFTGERSTVSNGALAASRVINSTISKEANLYVLVKFPLEITYEQLQIFKDQLTMFFKNRPREWIVFTRFRPVRFEINEGFVEYIICAQHRLPWSKWGDLKQSCSDLQHFCMELQKHMNLLYKQPAQPVDVTIRNGGGALTDSIPMSPLPAFASPGGGGVATGSNPQFTALQSLFAPKVD